MLGTWPDSGIPALMFSLISSAFHFLQLKLRHIKHLSLASVTPNRLLWLAMTFLVFWALCAGVDITMGALPRLCNILPFRFWLSHRSRTLIVGVVLSTAFSMFLSLTSHLLLCLLLRWRGWSIKTSYWTPSLTLAWMSAVRVLCGPFRKARALQICLPSPPVPSLQSTLSQYESHVRAIGGADEMKRVQNLCRTFQKKPGRTLQLFLQLKSFVCENYVSEEIERTLLKSRKPLLAGSTYFLGDALPTQTANQAARAANLVHATLLFRKSVRQGDMQPVLLQGVIPTCCKQFSHLFDACRVPGTEQGNFYKLWTTRGDLVLPPSDLQWQISWILSSCSQRSTLPPEACLAALTTGPRPVWAETRSLFLSAGRNKISSSALEKAAFVLLLDSGYHAIEEYHGNGNGNLYCNGRSDYHDNISCNNMGGYQSGSGEKCQLESNQKEMSRFGRHLMLGMDRWFDKSLSIIVLPTGAAGLLAECSLVDPAVASHFWRDVLTKELCLGYTAAGDCQGDATLTVTPPHLFEWNIPFECHRRAAGSLSWARSLARNTELLMLPVHDLDFGRQDAGFTNTQLALQLASFRDRGKFCASADVTPSRLCSGGRSDLVWTISKETCDFVLAMENPDVPLKVRHALMQVAGVEIQTRRHQARVGLSPSSHLLVLAGAAKIMGARHPLLQEVSSQDWGLLTIQLETMGGFGPLCADGYTVCYTPSASLQMFCITCSRTSPHTDSWRFGGHLFMALHDIAALHSPEQRKITPSLSTRT
uniref:carnitine O-palmitoyltransferase 1, liver isoform-like isoform X2 n=1 Tax=Myxine glutinosa TaxID=7769 RepID=UPI00358E1E28